MMTLSAIISGVLLALSFPPANAYPLAWAALIPILAVVGRTTFRETVLLGYLFGVAFYGGVLWWITPAYVFNGAPWWHGAICFLTVTHYLAFMIAVPFMVTYRYLCIPNAENRGPHPWLLAVLPMLAGALWTGFEYIATHAVDAFAAGIMGYCQWKFLSIAQLSSLFGVQAVSFLIIAANAAFSVAILRQGYRSIAVTVGPSALVIIVCWSYGIWKLNSVRTAGSEQRIALLQGNFSTTDTDSWSRSFAEYKKLAIRASQNRPTLIVWPESAVPPAEALVNELHDVAKLAKETKTWHLLGIIRRDLDRHYSSAVLLDDQGRMAGFYDKVHLMPFGEYIPLKSVLGRFMSIMARIQMLDSGLRPNPISSPAGVLGTSICHEIAYPQSTSILTLQGAEALINQSNEMWFKKLPVASELQDMMATFRAIENRRQLFRVVNAGASTVFDSAGRTIKSLGRGASDVLEAPIQTDSRRSFYVTSGDLFPWLCIACVLIVTGLCGGALLFAKHRGEGTEKHGAHGPHRDIGPPIFRRFKFGKTIMLFIICGSLQGCASQHAFIYAPQGPIQVDTAFPFRVGVKQFRDARSTTKRLNAVLCLLPFVPVVFQFDRPDGQHFFGAPYQFNPSEDLARAMVYDLGRSRLFSEVFYADDTLPSDVDLVVEGTINSTRFRGRVFTYSLTVFPIGGLLWLLGLPTGTSDSEIDLTLQLLEVNGRQVVWEGRLVGRTDHFFGPYYNWQSRTGSYSLLAEQIFQDAIRDIAYALAARQNQQKP